VSPIVDVEDAVEKKKIYAQVGNRTPILSRPTRNLTTVQTDISQPQSHINKI
jgi:hypothetical protein